ncbi:hypothetical protein [Enterococcus sp. AZ196]|uniref:hypothetical protein n=1 Tax=Enterococcus sp. AZ196 TaxID=2774659 RepID=UPI003D278D2B
MNEKLLWQDYSLRGQTLLEVGRGPRGATTRFLAIEQKRFENFIIGSVCISV